MNVLVNGIHGKMGQVLQQEIDKIEDLEVVAGVSKDTDLSTIEDNIDIIIDFSTPAGTMNILEYAKQKQLPIVIATTGFNQEEQKIIKESSKEIPIFQSSNMSLEINIMCDMVAKLAKQLKNSDIEIIETHHRNKIDAPSGTAFMLANSINESLNNEMNYTYDRHSVKQKRTDKEIGINSIRGGTEVGKHSVMFFGDNESFEITHTVTSRSIFAKGAIQAALFLKKQPNGYYNMKDLIKGE